MAWKIGQTRGDDYDAVFDRRAAAGEDIHGEASFVERFRPSSVLDAGCGTGRVSRELARRGIAVVGVDRDPEMLRTAQRKAPRVAWRCADLAVLDLGRTFDVVLLAGEVMNFLDPGSEAMVVATLVRHLAPSGRLIAGFNLRADGPTVEHYDALAATAGLALQERWATWDRQPWRVGSSYALSVHGRAS
jgi:SAM-dependent methyltransferase